MSMRITAPTLFALPTDPSPRLRWMERHGVRTEKTPRCATLPWNAWVGDWNEAISSVWVCDGEDGGRITGRRFCTAATEEDALAYLAVANGWRLWNEETV